jgi:hypothetical protein
MAGLSHRMAIGRGGLHVLSGMISGAATLVWDGLDRFAEEYALMLMRGQPLPAEAAGELAKILADCRDLKNCAACLRNALELTASS